MRCAELTEVDRAGSWADKLWTFGAKGRLLAAFSPEKSLNAACEKFEVVEPQIPIQPRAVV